MGIAYELLPRYGCTLVVREVIAYLMIQDYPITFRLRGFIYTGKRKTHSRTSSNENTLANFASS
jgi:hypothetical protein